MRISDWSSDVCSSDLTNNVADKACHVVGSATQVGLTQALALMRYIIPIITGVAIVLAGCQPSRDYVLADAAQRQAEVLRQAEAKQTLQAFGGTLVGQDEGEWGGEGACREQEANTYTAIAHTHNALFQ